MLATWVLVLSLVGGINPQEQIAMLATDIWVRIVLTSYYMDTFAFVIFIEFSMNIQYQHQILYIINY